MMRLFFLLLPMLILITATPLYAQQETLFQDSVQEAAAPKEPLEISADETLEWNRSAKTFKATKNAMAKQGDTIIQADALEAQYREEEGNSMVLYKMIATGNVKITSKESVAYGDLAEYDIDSGKAIMTGESLKMESTDQTLTASDNFEYWVEEGRITANGNVKIVRPKKNQKGQDILEAATASAYLKEDNQGKRVFERLVAQQSVVITTPTEVLRGNKASYLALSNVAEISGNVSITRGQNKLEGARASVDLNTNISRMFSSADSGATKRVRGTFYPGSTKKSEDEDEQTQPQANDLEGFETPEVVPKSIQRIRPLRSRSSEKKQLAPVQLKKLDSMIDEEELQKKLEGEEVELLDVPNNKMPEELETAPLTGTSGSANSFE